MYCLKLPTLLMLLSVALNCLNTAPTNRYSTVSREQLDIDPQRENWLFPGFSKNSFLSFSAAFPVKEPFTETSHHMEKRKCNTATCVTQRLADYLIRSSSNKGMLYAPTNVGSNTYGKRDSMEPLIREPLKYLQY
ncbi:islet amyloid polypeptide [Polypterus senegalus]|nr:islet amyloid polypeptide [Polypterus senegalus]